MKHMSYRLAGIGLWAMMFAVISPVAIAHGGGGGGGGFSGGGNGGDSSMNPFTGDSYAYFHGGRNLGEEGTIRPNRPPPQRQSKANAAPTVSAKQAAPDAAEVTLPRDDQRSQAQSGMR